MAAFVLAGRADCPYYAKAELLTDYLQLNLPSFRVHKIPVLPEEWEAWLSATCRQHGWRHTTSPLVWRELVERGGRGALLGGYNDFMEYVQGYYGMVSPMLSELMLTLAQENLHTQVKLTDEQAQHRELSRPFHVCITGANSACVPGLLWLLGTGELCGGSTGLSVCLLGKVGEQEALRCVRQDTLDMACAALRDVTIHSDPELAFDGAGLVIVLDNVAPGLGQEWSDAGAPLCAAYGSALGRRAGPDVRVLVAAAKGANLRAQLLATAAAPHVPRRNFVALSTHLERRAKGLLAAKLKVNSAGVEDVVVWGDAGGSTYTQLSAARLRGYDGAVWGPGLTYPLLEVLNDREWLENEFPAALQARGSLQAKAQGYPATTALNAAIASTLRLWFHGSDDQQIHSLAVPSNGEYGLLQGLVFSLPVRFEGGDWSVVSDLSLTDAERSRIHAIAAELQEEIEAIFTNANHASLLSQDPSRLQVSEKADSHEGQFGFPSETCGPLSEVMTP
ncbi:putative malate dehydrogenase 1B isoform X1 [Petromyzon marinus]|uniref:Malate dehydrogenase 1B isoform X1 n=2 Tax=Petromyzon marinus TaxID=7757 RepID=A0AAJ7TPH2_PETMA|nr:putative malate dehydrogenase 1B isoform X1 [Petromyzon marinus]